MEGYVNQLGCALLEIEIAKSPEARLEPLLAWIDTAFLGELMLPLELIRDLGMRTSAVVAATLADGTKTRPATAECVIEWFGERRWIEVIASASGSPLIGIDLLFNHRLTIDYPGRTILLE